LQSGIPVLWVQQGMCQVKEGGKKIFPNNYNKLTLLQGSHPNMGKKMTSFFVK
jgi:hypothetical protein